MPKNNKPTNQPDISINRSGSHKSIRSNFKTGNSSVSLSKPKNIPPVLVPPKKKLEVSFDKIKMSGEHPSLFQLIFKPPNQMGPVDSPFILIKHKPLGKSDSYIDGYEDIRPGYRWFAEYERGSGEKVRIFYNRKIHFQPDIVIHFLPTIDASFSYDLTRTILNSPCFAKIVFKVSSVEIAFDFHGYQILSIRKWTWTSARKFFYAYGGKGNTKMTKDPKKVEGDFTSYQGNRGNKLTRVYLKTECGRTFPRCEIEIGREALKKHGVNIPEDLQKGFDWVFKYIRWVKFDLERFERIHGSKPRLKRALKKYDLKYVHHLLKEELGSIPNFGRYLEDMKLTMRLAKVRLKRFQDRFNGF